MNNETNKKTLILENFIKDTTKNFEKKIQTTITDKKIVILLKGGKHLRPIIAHLSFKVYTKGKETPNKYQKSLEGAVCIELAHTASLIFDDIIDKDKERRGQTAFHIKEGIPNALLVGNKMIAIGNEIALKHGKKLAKLYVKTWKECLDGELNEVNYNQNDIKNELIKMSIKSTFFREYYSIINMKTASLFASSCRAGALEADAPDNIIEILGEYGREVGLAYQLADDLVDLKNGEMIRSVIVPLTIKLENNIVKDNSLNLNRISKIIEKNKTKIEKIYVKEIKKHLDKAEKLSNSEKLPESQYKDILNKIPKYIINNMLKRINLKL